MCVCLCVVFVWLCVLWCLCVFACDVLCDTVWCVFVPWLGFVCAFECVGLKVIVCVVYDVPCDVARFELFCVCVCLCLRGLLCVFWFVMYGMMLYGVLVCVYVCLCAIVCDVCSCMCDLFVIYWVMLVELCFFFFFLCVIVCLRACLFVVSV